MCFRGTNDYGHGDGPIGNIGDDNPATFYGALNTLFRYLYEVYPNAYIFVMTPLYRLGEDNPIGDGCKEPTLPLSGYVNVIREVAKIFYDDKRNDGINIFYERCEDSKWVCRTNVSNFY